MNPQQQPTLQASKFGLYESWIPVQQKRHNLEIAVLAVHGEAVAVVEVDGVWTLPTAPHNGRYPGLMVAVEKVRELNRLEFAPGPKLLGNYDVKEPDRFVAVVKVSLQSFDKSSSRFRLVGSLEELNSLGEVDELVFAALMTAYPARFAWREASGAEVH